MQFIGDGAVGGISGVPQGLTASVSVIGNTDYTEDDGDNTYTRLLGLKQYELKDHLGNVRAVVTDRKLPGATDGTYKADLLTAQEYYPFGMAMPGRQFNFSKYRFGFNGKEKDDEISGNGNSYDFGARIYDPRIGRWLSVDPLQKKYPNLTPYNAFENNPVVFKDIEGKEAEYSVDGTTITVKATIYLMNSDATSEQAKSVQDAIMDKWQGPFTYVKGNITYTMKFEVEVKTASEYKGDAQKDKSSNIVMLKDKGKLRHGTSHVWDGFLGIWDKNPGRQKAYAHEFGHILGLGDQYISLDEKGWLPAIRENGPGVAADELMGLAPTDNPGKAKVTNADIQAIGDYIMENKSNDGKGIIQANGLNLAGEETKKQKQHYITSVGYDEPSQ